METQPSPSGLGKHASDYEDGTILKGNDGNDWVVKIRGNGSHFWIKTLPTLKNKIIGKGPISVKVCEPGTLPSTLKEFKKNALAGKIYKITTEFLEILNKKPKRVRKSGKRYYFIFGKRFPEFSYYFAEYVGNDIAQMGIIDVKKRIAEYKNDNYIDNDQKLLGIDKKWNFNYDSREYLRELRTLFPSVIFVGRTLAGDVGVNVLIHLNSKKNIDGLILESWEF